MQNQIDELEQKKLNIANLVENLPKTEDTTSKILRLIKEKLDPVKLEL